MHDNDMDALVQCCDVKVSKKYYVCIAMKSVKSVS